MLTLEVLEAQPGAMKARLGVLEVHPAANEAYPGATMILPMEPLSGVIKAHLEPWRLTSVLWRFILKLWKFTPELL
jgi:hypothetical protein